MMKITPAPPNPKMKMNVQIARHIMRKNSLVGRRRAENPVAAPIDCKVLLIVYYAKSHLSIAGSQSMSHWVELPSVGQLFRFT